MSMQRRTFLSLIAVPAIAQLLPSCGNDSGSDTTPTGPVKGDRASLMGTAAHVSASPADALAASLAINAFSADLYEQLVAVNHNANLVFSPASIALALAMTSAGAMGTTLAEMDTVLHITDPATIHHSFNGLSTALTALNKTVDNTSEGGTGTSEVQLSIANSLWAQMGLGFEQAFLDLLSSEYDAGVELVDYRSNPEAARAQINGWVNDQTEERIPQLLGEGTITADSRLTLVNAIYLKANWANAFSKEATFEQPFAAPTGEVTVSMMHRSGHVGYAKGDGWQAVELPYVFGGLSFVAVIGDDATPAVPAADEVFAALTRTKVDLGLPRFDIETSTSLAGVLGAMGMVAAFSDADFSGMTADEKLLIGDVIHQANITVDEEGTEAAAATAVSMVATAMPEEEVPVVLTIDRPFTFWLRDTDGSTVLFAGRVNDPSAG
ncbi:MAG TPA: serpin family protein [Ilumatobacteraceae bacterium]|nr:serpin family protein [Ilumatobacteraceae bacterium]HRB02765.1 serpin family protein [Ilumatobacteraceae bacterium]